VLKSPENVLNMLGKTSLSCIQDVLYVLYVSKPAKRADFGTISRFVNLLMMTNRGRNGAPSQTSQSSLLWYRQNRDVWPAKNAKRWLRPPSVGMTLCLLRS
jgi:hypothetical protein